MSERKLPKESIEALKVADAIEKLPPHLYNQKLWGFEEDCGTAACICGWVCRINGRHEGDIDFAARLLGLSDDAKDALFRASPVNPDRKLSPLDAARVLRHLAIYREVNWRILVPEDEYWITQPIVEA